jgi:hypothetical protein
MTLSKFRFFLLLLLIVSSPFLIYKFIWLAKSRKANGIMGFVGKTYSGTYVHVYSNIMFIVDKDTIWFNGNDNIFFKEGETVPVRYQVSNPEEARIDNFAAIWGDTVVYGGIPVLILIALFLHPAVIPRKSKIRLKTGKPFISLENKM